MCKRGSRDCACFNGGLVADVLFWSTCDDEDSVGAYMRDPDNGFRGSVKGRANVLKNRRNKMPRNKEPLREIGGVLMAETDAVGVAVLLKEENDRAESNSEVGTSGSSKKPETQARANDSILNRMSSRKPEGDFNSRKKDIEYKKRIVFPCVKIACLRGWNGLVWREYVRSRRLNNEYNCCGENKHKNNRFRVPICIISHYHLMYR